jgi:hypothetical protein
MKKIPFGLRSAMLVLLLSVVFACGSDAKYSDARDLFEDQITVTEDYVNGLEEADSASSVATTINKFTDDMKDLIPRIRAFREKYPEFAAMTDKTKMPDELRDTAERLRATSAKVQTATMNMVKYMMDPDVQKAVQRMGKELSALAK